MIEFGNTLRAAREAKGYDIGQLAEMTRMAPKTIRELEAEDFTNIAAPIYGRGFVKLYCEAVGLDPKAFVLEFMEIYNGNRSSDIQERPTKNDSAAPTPSEITTPQETESQEVQTPEPETVTPPPVAKLMPDLFNQGTDDTPVTPTAPEPEPTLSRYASPISKNRADFNPSAYFRLGILTVGALLFLVAIVFSIRAIYRATTSREEVVPAAEKPQAPKSVPTADMQPKKARTPQKIPSLYLD